MGFSCMKRNALRPLLCLSVLFVIAEGLSAWQSPVARSEPERDNPFVSGTLRLQLRYKDWLPSLETNYRYETDSQGNMRTDGAVNTTADGLSRFRQQPWHAMVGSYYNILNSLMVGGFYRYAQGERHRNDWVGSGWAETGSSVWDWFRLNTNDRPEHSAIGDITFRYRLGFLPGENWVFELKNRAVYTWYNDARYASRDNWGQHSAAVAETKYVVRPGLQYFWLDGDRPFVTFYTQYEAHFALNFGTRRLVESWAYFGFLYHLSEEVALGLNLAYAQWWWSESDSVRNIRAAENCQQGSAIVTCNTMQYVTTQRAFIVGALALFRFDLTPIE
ncbi:MAG: hypothetical protein OHK0011_22440 [Turneriella sp.]